jgi:hypothetical protein
MSSILISLDDSSLSYNDVRRNKIAFKGSFSTRINMLTSSLTFTRMWKITDEIYNMIYFNVMCKNYDLAIKKMKQIAIQQEKTNSTYTEFVLFADIIATDTINVSTNKEEKLFEDFLNISKEFPFIKTTIMTIIQYNGDDKEVLAPPYIFDDMPR